MSRDMQMPYVLGLDIGVNSVGWVVMPVKEAAPGAEPVALRDMGARVFDAGNDGKVSEGNDQSRNIERREARQRRKQLDRRARRKTRLLHALQCGGLLPSGEVDCAADRQRYFSELDPELFVQSVQRLTEFTQAARLARVLFPYLLRAAAVSGPLPPYAIGRALYHLGQRRGFVSNRKQAAKPDEDFGPVLEDIAALRTAMKDANAPTLGVYLAGLDPHETRIRERWTHRDMYKDEFDKIWATQHAYHPELMNDALKKEIHTALFFQRRLKSQTGLIGRCELEPDARRAPWFRLMAQRFRLLQQLNNLEYVTEHGEVLALDAAQRNRALEHLEFRGDLSFAALKKLLGLSTKGVFNLERGGEKLLRGNRTASKLYKVFGERWLAFTDAEREQLVEDLHCMADGDALARRGRKVWGLSEEEARNFAAITLEPGYCNHSLKALSRLLPMLEQGVRYGEARKKAYHEASETPALETLPPLEAVLPNLRNPNVARALGEMRKIVNAAIKKYGKPVLIRVELARELKRSRKQRQEIFEKNRLNEAARKKAAKQLAEECNIKEPSRQDTLKVLLAEECNWQCPYTGVSFGLNDLFGPEPLVDVEHIIPFRRCFDDSYTNKTLCLAEENRTHKRDRTPFEAYAGDQNVWREIIERVKRFSASDKAIRAAKLRRFLIEDAQTLFDDFTTRQLNDTRYAASLARKYLGVLFGEASLRRVQVGAGQATAYIRNELGLHGVLGVAEKRADHRHHGIDAIAIALTTPGMFKRLSEAAARAPLKGRRRFDAIEAPWEGFLDHVRELANRTLVSVRLRHTLSGPLHKQTIYGLTVSPEDGKSYNTVRKRLASLSANEVEKIFDPHVRAQVASAVREAGGDPKKAFGSLRDGFCYTDQKGRERRVDKVRIKASIEAISVGRAPHERLVASGSNHHLAVYESKDAKGRPCWNGELVSRYEAQQRKRRKQPVVRRGETGHGRFLFSLAGGDVIALTEAGVTACYRVRSISQEKTGAIRVEYVGLSEAGMKDVLKATGKWRSSMLNPLRKLHCEKVLITPLGEKRRAHD